MDLYYTFSILVVLSAFFSYINSRYLKLLKNYKVWQDGNHPELLFSNEFLQQKLEYVHMNPVVAEFVDEPEYYWYSSARDYYTKQKGLLEIELLQ